MQYGRLLLPRTQLFLPSYWSATFTLFNQSRQLGTLIFKSIIIIYYSEWYKQPKFQRLIFIIHFPLVCVLKGEHMRGIKVWKEKFSLWFVPYL